MSMHHERPIRRQIVEFARLLHARGWVANHDGNVSARVADKSRFVITPSGVSKRLCETDGLVACSLVGRALSNKKPPSETSLHVGAYRRDDVFAVVHAHPPEASAFAVMGRALAPIVIPEIVVSLGDQIPLVPLVLSKDPTAPDKIAEALASADVALLVGNGVLAVGADLEQAYLRLELVEHYAGILRRALQLGAPQPLSHETVRTLLADRKKAGLGPMNREVAPPVRAVIEGEVRRAIEGNKP